jgi:hypothetical protein
MDGSKKPRRPLPPWITLALIGFFLLGTVGGSFRLQQADSLERRGQIVEATVTWRRWDRVHLVYSVNGRAFSLRGVQLPRDQHLYLEVGDPVPVTYLAEDPNIASPHPSRSRRSAMGGIIGGCLALLIAFAWETLNRWISRRRLVTAPTAR